MEIWPGRAAPLGATWDGEGTNFSVFSSVAERIELCLFDAAGRETRADLPERTAFCWHGYVPGAGPGQRYGFRVHGPWDPARGLRCNPGKLLLDPYARAIDGEVRWGEEVFGHRRDDADARHDADSAPAVPRSIVVDPRYDWGDDRPPALPRTETIVYEVHVKGFTARHPAVPPELRGTYAGLAHPAALAHLRRLGVTAVEILPVHHFVHDGHLLAKGLRNYWGYNSIGYFAPHAEYAAAARADGAGGQVREFRDMVRALHAAGLEVILDVVYNHTAEGNGEGPTLCFRGLDNPAYYRLDPENPRQYVDYTGTGNSLNMREPYVLQLLMDSLRYWVTEMHVDGFRFDLAATLARELFDVDRLGGFFDVIHQDPVISRVKLIAEPWDLGPGGYQVGNFPPLWMEWNGKYRDTVRDYWRGQPATLDELAFRLTGSSDLYSEDGRRPTASVNFVTAHDGFTLADLVAYDEKHNEANGEGNRDGESHNRSWNCGVEGPTADPEVLACRRRRQRSFLATLLLSQGVPMLLGGDELGRTQRGNNNAYCQDDELSWFDWEGGDEELLEFTARLVRFRRRHPVFRRRRFFQGRPVRGTGSSDIVWLRPDGLTMRDEDWAAGFARSLAVFLNGRQIPSRGPRGERIADASFLLLFNAHHEPVLFRLPEAPWSGRWLEVLDTAKPLPEDGAETAAGEEVAVAGRAVVVLRRVEV
ncbi:MAG TPA: glycogen debranching protein GlgX [Thermoanaerobaculia bacterium]|nr:glycogen debranching protein GlgX [Thermoanaerobaculia bacterium]